MGIQYNNRAYVSSAPGAFYAIAATDFGVPVPAAATVTLVSTGGAFSTGSAVFKVAWITAEGLSAIGAATTITGITLATNEFTVVQPTLPAKVNGVQNVIGWQIYSSNSSGAAPAVLLNTASTTPAPVNITTSEGVEAGFLVATSTVTVLAPGTGGTGPTLDNSGIQPAFAAIGASTAAEYYAIIPNTGSQWKQQKSVSYMNADGISENLGIVLNHIDFIQPVYPGTANQPQASAASGSFMVMNGYLFEAVQAASASTAATFIGFSAFKLAKGSQTTDGNVTWQSYGKAGLARFQFSNVSTSPSTPAARAYELFQL